MSKEGRDESMASSGNSSDLRELQATLGISLARKGLLEQALTHGSLRHEQQTAAAPGEHSEAIADNERMEFLGDAVVGLAVAEQLYTRYPELDEGALTRLRAALVSRKHLGQVGTQLGLGSYLRLGKAEERSGGRRKAVLLANCMEAVIAAIYLESGLPAAGAFVERVVVAPYVEALRDELRAHRAIGDYKSALQELLQGRHAGELRYTLQSESGPDHRKRFLVEARIRPAHAPEINALGEGSTKKKAEQEAARKVYEQLLTPRGLPETATDQNPERMQKPRAAPSLSKAPDASRGRRNQPSNQHDESKGAGPARPAPPIAVPEAEAAPEATGRKRRLPVTEPANRAASERRV